MAGQKTAQTFGGGLASNPANGITNLPLNAQGGSSGVSPDELLGLLSEFISADSRSAIEFKPRFEDVLGRLTRPEMTDAVQKIVKAIDMAQDPRKRTKDPNTGKYDPTAQELAQRLADKVKTMNESSNEKTSRLVTFNLREAQARKPKKKTRGNPFRVLMGKVGKLLDHGLEKRDITRYLLKQKMWNEETIERAIDIVRDYNKKKRREGDDGDSKSSEKSKKEASVIPAELMARVQHRLASMSDEEFDQFIRARFAVTKRDEEGAEFEAVTVGEGLELDHSDNLEPGDNGGRKHQVDPVLAPQKKVAATRMAQEANSIYDVKADFSKRSTTELMARATWLMSLKDYGKDTPQGDGKKAADTKGVNAELKAIRKALEDRGFDAEELSSMGMK